MSALPRADVIAQELLTAREIATLLKISPRAVRLRMEKLGVAPASRDGLQSWAFGFLPLDYQDELSFVKKRSGAWTIAEAVKFSTPTWEPKKVFAKLPAYSQEKAFKVKAAMTAYYDALDRGLEPHQARSVARQTWLGEFAKSCSDKTILRWIDKVEARGGIEHARIEAFADEKSCDHKNQRLEARKQNRVPGELIQPFKLRCVQMDMNMAAAHRSFVKDWNEGREVPGVGKMAAPGQPFPFKLSQLRKFAPSTSARALGNKGKAAAQRDALPHSDRTYADLRPCEMYVLDDTRINVAVHCDLTGGIIEMKAYVMMELASRKIVAYVLREGSVRAEDVDELVAIALRTSGLAHIRAGYKTTIIFERGTVACSPARQRFLESVYLDQLLIKRTSMDGGRNFAGDYVQKASGHWMGKGAIESFMKTLGLLLRDIPGQRGSTYRETPAVVGDMNKPHAGGIVDESLKTVQAAREAAFLQSLGKNVAPNSLESVQALGVRPALLHKSQFHQAFARAIMHYNAERDHRREGFDLIGIPKANGGLDHVAESSDDRWHKLLWREKQRGTAPEPITPADASMLLDHKARPVTVTQQGVYVTVGKIRYRFWHPASEACAAADQVTGSKKKFVGLVLEDDLSEIHILSADEKRWVETLPLYKKAGANNQAELKVAYDEKKSGLDRARYELAQITAGQVEDRTAQHADEAKKIRNVVATTVGPQLVNSVSALCRGLKKAKRQAQEQRDRAQQSDSRHHPTAQDKADLIASFMKPEVQP